MRATDPRARNFLVDFFGNAQLDIWAMFASQWLSPADERKYRDRYETATLTVAAPSALPTMERLLALHRAGRLSIVKGAGAVTLAADGSAYAIAHEHGSERATTLINTMGSVDRDVVSTRQPALIRDLVRQGLLQSHARDGVAMKGAAIDMAAFRLPATRRVHYVGMLLWGPGFFTSSAFLMATFVERALEAMFGEG